MTAISAELLDGEILAQEDEKAAVWNARPFQLVSLLEMLERYALFFYKIGEVLRLLHATAFNEARNTPDEGNNAIPENVKIFILRDLNKMKEFCRMVDLHMTLRATERLLARVDEGISMNTLLVMLPELGRRIEDELDLVLFMHVPTNRAEYYPSETKEYKEKPLLSPKTAKKFSKFIEDIEEAGKCFALARYTACVFHLMRVMERGVQRLGRKLNVTIPVEEKDWGKISSAINGAIKQLPNSTTQEKRTHAHYTKVAVYLDNVREAWRNPTMHPKATYTEEEAENCIRFVKAYTEYLAKML